MTEFWFYLALLLLLGLVGVWLLSRLLERARLADALEADSARHTKQQSELDHDTKLRLALVFELLALALSAISMYIVWSWWQHFWDGPVPQEKRMQMWLLCRFMWIVLTVTAIRVRRRCSRLAALSLASFLGDVYFAVNP